MATRNLPFVVITRRLAWKCKLCQVKITPNGLRAISIVSCHRQGSHSAEYLPSIDIFGSRNKQNSASDAKRRFLYSLALLSYAYALRETDSKMSDSEIIEAADSLYEKSEFIKLYELLSSQKDSKNAEILWRFARAARDYSQLSITSVDDRKTLIYEGYKAAEAAVGLDDSIFACHKWYGIMLSEIGDYEGTKQKIQNSYKIRDHFMKAIDLNKNDPTSHYLLGVWFFTFADLPWFQRKIAATVFASPPSCTYEEAHQCFLKAESIEPGFYAANLLMLAKTCIKLGKKDEAKHWLENMLKCTAKTESDVRDINEGRKLLSSL